MGNHSQFRVTSTVTNAICIQICPSYRNILEIFAHRAIAEALTGLIYHRPAGENPSFSSFHSFSWLSTGSSLATRSQSFALYLTLVYYYAWWFQVQNFLAEFKITIKVDFLSWQKSLAYSLQIFVDNFPLLSTLQRVLTAWLKFSANLLFAASKCYVTIQRQW